jgi:hypothetical protein
MRPKVLLLVSLAGMPFGTLVGALIVRAGPPCTETAICRVDVRRGGGCLPGPCDAQHDLPVALWLGVVAGLVLGFLVAFAYEMLRTRRARATD